MSIDAPLDSALPPPVSDKIIANKNVSAKEYSGEMVLRILLAATVLIAT